jgi:hypothetical protein
MRVRRVGSRAVVAAFLALVAASCASTGESSGGERRNTNELLPDEIRAAPVSNLYEAVEQLRPRWLQIRSVRSLSGGGGEIGVFVNRTHVGGPEVLRSMSVDGVARLRYLDGPAASAQFRSAGGDGFPGGIIVETVDGR